MTAKQTAKQALPDPHTLALQALAWLASDEERLVRFLNLSGMTPRGLRATATHPESLGAVLDYLLAWEPLLLSFSEEHGVAPEIIAHSRQRLPGAPLLN
ncbi:MAG TPA: DUF3572 family protein [Dongiaceae bacterium]|jgi:hypothetical protein